MDKLTEKLIIASSNLLTQEVRVIEVEHLSEDTDFIM